MTEPLGQSSVAAQEMSAAKVSADPPASVLGKRTRDEVQMPAAVLNVDRLFADSDCFRHCLQNRNCYVDRTQYIQYSVGRQRVAFRRPRRFGESLRTSTPSGSESWRERVWQYV